MLKERDRETREWKGSKTTKIMIKECERKKREKIFREETEKTYKEERDKREKEKLRGNDWKKERVIGKHKGERILPQMVIFLVLSLSWWYDLTF